MNFVQSAAPLKAAQCDAIDRQIDRYKADHKALRTGHTPQGMNESKRTSKEAIYKRWGNGEKKSTIGTNNRYVQTKAAPSSTTTTKGPFLSTKARSS